MLAPPTRLRKEGGGVHGLDLSLPPEGGDGRGVKTLLHPHFRGVNGKGIGDLTESLFATSSASSAAAAAAAKAEGSSLSHSFAACSRDCRSKCNCRAEREMARCLASFRYRDV